MKKYFLLCVGKQDKTTAFCAVDWVQDDFVGKMRPVAPVYHLEAAEALKAVFERDHSDQYTYLIVEASEEYLQLIGEN